MTGTREGAIARARARFDSGAYLEDLRRLVAVPTESQMPDRLPDLARYCAETLPGVMAGMGFEAAVLENPEPGRGPVMLATRIEDPSLPTVLIYGHGDVVRGLAGRCSAATVIAWQRTCSSASTGRARPPSSRSSRSARAAALRSISW